jgi:hypothetical protein
MPYTAAACPGCGRRMVSTGGMVKSGQSSSIDILERTPYSECRAQDCVFNVTEQDATCPNCAIPNPHRARPNAELATALSSQSAGCYLIISIFVMEAVVGGIGASLFGRYVSVGPFVIITTAISIGVPVLVFRHLSRKAGLVRDPSPDPDYSSGMSLTLKSSESIIQQRIKDLKAREQQLGSVMERAKHNTGEQWERVRRTLADAIEIVHGQSARYQVKLTEISLVRWQNRLAPLLYGWDGLNYEQNEARLRALETSRGIGSEIRAKILEYKKSLGETPDVKELLSRMEDTLGSYKKVHEGLVARQAVLALQGVSPVREALSPASYPTAGKREGEVFNAHAAITDFSSSFAELEAEYTRLQSEGDVAQEIGRILKRVDPT